MIVENTSYVSDGSRPITILIESLNNRTNYYLSIPLPL